MQMLFVGLGNPGTRYERTRHNIGFMVLDHLVAEKNCIWEPGNGPWLEASLKFAGKDVRLVKPTTYMNDSGKAVKSLCTAHGIPASQVVVVVDEYNFPTGRIHLRNGGSDGGHNGLTSIIVYLGTPNFWRLRCGISRNFGPGELVDYVLGEFPDTEQPEVQKMLANGAEALLRIMKSDPVHVMQWVNNIEARQEK